MRHVTGKKMGLFSEPKQKCASAGKKKKKKLKNMAPSSQNTRTGNKEKKNVTPACIFN
jgi:hypothetical protein